jgi:beta-phosphoglucomutase-like phosphatase (HAD superfamily)
MPVRQPPRGPALPFDPDQVKLLVCDADRVLFPCSDQDETALLRPDPDVLGAMMVLEQRFALALATTVDGTRAEELLDACGMRSCFPTAYRFTAAAPDDPAPYLGALAEHRCFGGDALAVVASQEAAEAARRAGTWVTGNLQYVDPRDRPEQSARLLEAGAHTVVTSWEHLLVTLVG